jgi:hypothetical protein
LKWFLRIHARNWISSLIPSRIMCFGWILMMMMKNEKWKKKHTHKITTLHIFSNQFAQKYRTEMKNFEDTNRYLMSLYNYDFERIILWMYLQKVGIFIWNVGIQMKKWVESAKDACFKQEYWRIMDNKHSQRGQEELLNKRSRIGMLTELCGHIWVAWIKMSMKYEIWEMNNEQW